MTTWRVDFNRPCLLGREREYMAQAIENKGIAGDGVFGKTCQAWLERELGVGRVLLTTSCTHALEMAAVLVGIEAGDEVVVPSFTFVSTVNAFVLRGARPVFVDIRPDTLNMDERLVAECVTSRTKAMVPVHYAGVGCEMDAILDIAQSRGIAVVEDNAHGLFGRYKGKTLGTFGCLAAQSFHETKNVTCGEGGALLINDPRYAERAEVLREKGTDRSKFFRGQVDKYTWVDIGSSYVLSDLLAAFLLAQLERREWILTRRQRIWERYNTELAGWAAENGIRLPHVPAHCEQPYHMFYLIMPSAESRTAFIRWMKEQGVYCVFHYLPLNTSPMGIRFGGRRGQCPVTEEISERLVRLPFYTTMGEEEQSAVTEAALRFRT